MNFIFDSYENAKYDKIIKTRGGKQLAFIEFNHVTKEYFGEVNVKAVDQCSFSIEKGELVVILG